MACALASSITSVLRMTRARSMPDYTDSLPRGRSLDRHAFGQIARLVHVVAAEDGGVVGHELEGDDGEHRAERLGDVRDVEDVLRVLLDLLVALGGDGDDVAAPGANFL